MWKPNFRSASRASSAAARTGKAISTRIDVTSAFQVKIGIRNIVMPGARMQKIVVTKLTPVRIVPRPDSTSPKTHMSAPTPGENVDVVSGVYAYQPKDAAPPGVRKLNMTISPPNRNIQYDSMLSRGNATSGEPICSGMIQLVKPANSGVANSNNMIVPWIVNSWLYWSAETTC